jgi:hypothetical protein
MFFSASDLFRTTDDDFVDLPVAARRPAPQPGPRRRLTVEALAWVALVLLSFGPLIGYLLATLL